MQRAIKDPFQKAMRQARYVRIIRKIIAASAIVSALLLVYYLCTNLFYEKNISNITLKDLKSGYIESAKISSFTKKNQPYLLQAQQMEMDPIKRGETILKNISGFFPWNETSVNIQAIEGLYNPKKNQLFLQEPFQLYNERKEVIDFRQGKIDFDKNFMQTDKEISMKMRNFVLKANSATFDKKKIYFHKGVIMQLQDF